MWLLQQDLLAEDVFILDAHDRIYVWLGQEARPGEKDLATEAALVCLQNPDNIVYAMW